MKISVHIPQELSDRLNTYLKQHKMPKNKFIVEAIEKTLAEREDQEAWHPDILNWQGVPEFEAGSLEEGLLPMSEDVI